MLKHVGVQFERQLNKNGKLYIMNSRGVQQGRNKRYPVLHYIDLQKACPGTSEE